MKHRSAHDIRGACALDCPDTCSWIVTVKGNDAIALRGDPEHPYTRGSLCNKVADYLDYVRSPERVGKRRLYSAFWLLHAKYPFKSRAYG